MARDHNYDASDNQPLSTRDLIILYKNIDVGTKLMSSANVGPHRAPNQHVETVVYKDDRESEDSDASEVYSNEDLQDVFSINNERIDLINNLSSVQHPLCHKFGDIGFQSSNFSEYDSQFLFKDPYIKQQLKNINILPDTTEFDSILPATLLDYICCKRLEDNYNFYMDNIIRYVQHTIEQLKRISNGDYLTDRAKEKWREVDKDLVVPSSDSTKVLATSVSIPLHVMGKVDGHRSTWDDIVHSEVDVRSLSKILEKKIIIEVPKLICGSYRLFSERCADNLVISCKKDMKRDVDQDNGESRVDVVFQLKPSGSGHVISNINSIMILQKMPSITTNETNGDQIADAPLVNCNASIEENPKIIEIDERDRKEEHESVIVNFDKDYSTLGDSNMKSESDSSNSASLNNCLSSMKSDVDKGLLNKKVRIKTLKMETDFTVISPDELRCAIRRLNMQTPVPEESEVSETGVSKKKSPTSVRIKSPYENQSYTIEEKKRKKLLEIREKREKKKMALNERKVTKHKYGKGVVMAQPSSSVTKLSITNKSFYNSIYGEHLNQEGGISKKSRKLMRKDNMIEHESSKGECENAFYKSSFIALDGNTFDDETTETIMQMHPKSDTETGSIPVSANTRYSTDVNILSRLMGSSGTDFNSDVDTSPIRQSKRDYDSVQGVQEVLKDSKNFKTYQTSCNLVPANTPKESTPDNQQDGLTKMTTPIECRKSIDKIYDLLKKLGKHDDKELTASTTHILNNNEDLNIDGGSTIQVSDSGTSVKHHAISSNPSTFSFEKNNLSRHLYKDKKKKEAPITGIPKVLISTKLQTSKVDAEWNKTDRRRVLSSPSPKVPDNPLRAISQLLHEFNNVQKTRYKTHKKEDHVLVDGKTVSRGSSSKKTKQEPPSKDTGLASSKASSFKDRRPRLGQAPDIAQFSPHPTYVDDKHVGRLPRRNLSDIIDEAKEARGEAVRGPTKQFSRINSLAQPKKSYVQAHNEEHQHKYGKNIIANRLNRVTTSPPIVEKNTSTYTPRTRRRGTELAPVPLPRPGISAAPPLERVMRPKRSASNSPTRKRVPPPQLPNEASSRQLPAPKSPDLKNKMVAVESYVKNHYGHKPIDTGELKGHEVHKSRVPLIPNDIELASLSSPNAEESTALGNQLHYMVDTMINTNPPPLSALTECHDSASKLSDGLAKLSAESLLKIDERKSESDYPVDIFEDKSILTAVASIPRDKIHKVIDENSDSVDTFDVQQFNSATELHKLENALYQRMSVGAFPKRLRIKNLTLTPKQSLKQVIVVQSGDVGSMLVKSSLSQSLRSDSKTDSLTALKPLAELSNTNLNWGFTNIPMQVATIGYAFPTFQSTQSQNLAQCVQVLMQKSSNEDVCKSHKTSQCFKGVPTESCLEQATQANIMSSIASNIDIGNSKVQEESATKTLQGKNCEKLQPVTTICEKIRSISDKFERNQQAESPQMPKSNEEKCKKVNESHETLHKTIQQCEQTQPTSQLIEDVQPMPEQQNKDINVSKTSLNINKVINENNAERKSTETIEQSTSLDILMGLLNEIRKITGETVNKNSDNEHKQNSQSKELEIILNNVATHESSVDNNCRDLASVSSFDKLNRLDSTNSICFFNLKERNVITANNEDKAIQILKGSSVVCYKSNNMDKEVTVEIETKYVNKLTDVPSCFFPLPVNDNTTIDDSIIEIQRNSSTPSVYSLAKHETADCNLSIDNSLEQPKPENEELSPQDSARYFNVINDKKEKIDQNSVNVNVESIAVVRKRRKRTSKILTSTACVAIASNFDPLLKMKRDILVTVYSILVFTVFAALSFPKLFFQVEM